jgi:hypothetical protein
MAGIKKFSEQVIDYAERLSEVSDAAQGKHHSTNGGITRWVLLPASGAALYALVKSDFFSHQAKDVVDGAKARASELPDDLIARVRQTSERRSSSGNGAQRRNSAAANSTRRAKTARRPRSSGRTSSTRGTKSTSR